MNRFSTSQNELLAAYIYASQQLLIANEFEKRLPQTFDRIGKALNASRINVYRQEYLDNNRIKAWHEYSWRSYNDNFLIRISSEQEIIHQKTRTNRWDSIIGQQGYIQGVSANFPAEERPFMDANRILSILIVPIYVDDERWGIIGFDDCERERLWSDVEIDILKGLAGLIGTAIGNGRLYQAEQQARQRAELVRDLSRLIGENLSRTEIVQRILQELKHIITFDTSSIYITARDTESEFIAVSGFDDEEVISKEATNLLKDSPILYQMSQDLQSIISPDVRHLDGWIWIPGTQKIRSFIAAPMVYHQKMIGTLMLDSMQVDFFQTSDLHIVETLAQQIAVTLENSHLLKNAQQEAAQKTAILETSTAVSSSLSLDDTLTELAKQLCEGINATATYIVQIQPETEMMSVVAEHFTPAAENIFPSELESSHHFSSAFKGTHTWLYKGIPYVRHVDDPALTEKERQQLQLYNGNATLSLPLIIKEQIFGYAQLWQCEHRRAFTDHEIALCIGIAQQAAIAFENSTLFAKQTRQLQLSRTLQQVGGLLTSSLTLEQVYERLFDLLAQVVEYDTASLQVTDKSGSHVHYEIGRGFNDKDIAKKFTDSISQHSLEKIKKPPHWVLINDVASTANWFPVPPPLDLTKSWIGAALIVKDTIIGILNVDSHQPHAYTREIGETVATFANQAAIAVENARLYREVDQRISELTVLHHVAQTTASIIDQDELLYMTTKMIMQAIPYNSIGIAFISTEDPDVLIPHQSAYGFSTDPRTIRIPVHASMMGNVIKTGQTMLVNDTSQEPLYHDILDTPSGSEIAVPIYIRGKAVGAIYTSHSEINKFDEADVRFVTTLADQLSAAIERAHLYKGMQQQTKMLEKEVATRTAELRRERDRTIAILENAGENIIITDTNNLISYVNLAMEKASGYTRAELIGQHPRLWRSPHTKKIVYQRMRDSLQNGRSWRGEIVNKRKNGEEYDVLMSITPLKEDGEIVGYVSMQADIGRLKELERLKSKFVSNVSHELRTPLTNIKTYLTLLERGKPEKRPRYMQVMNQEVDRLARLLQDLLDLSRLEVAPMPNYLPPIDLITVMEKHFAVFSAKAEAEQINYEMKLPEMPLHVKITTDHAERLMVNLISNALTYTQKNGIVTLRANNEIKDGRPYICIYVNDNGPGIDPADLPHVLERFYRGKGKHASNIPGTGLGLAICNEIAQRYNGTIDVRSTLGEGTTVIVCLPISPDPA